MSKPDLSSLYKLEFYKKQDYWRLASKPRRRGKAKCSRGDFNKTYVLSKSTANITTKLNDAFLETDPESLAENEDGQEEKTLNNTQVMSSFTELWSNPEEPEKEDQPNPLTQKMKPSKSPPQKTFTKLDICISPTLKLPNIFLPDSPLHTDLWGEKVDFELNDCNDFVDPTPQSVENNTKDSQTNQNILVNLLKQHKFFINQLDNNLAVIDNGGVKDNNENQPRGDDQKKNLQNEQEQFNKLDILSKLKQKILQARLLNNNYLIPNANQQPIVENNGFELEHYFQNVENTVEEARRKLSLHEKNFKLTSQEQRNFERNFVESTLPTTFQKESVKNENTAQTFCNNMVSYKNSVKPFNHSNNNFHYEPTDLTNNSQNCYLNQNTSSPQNQYIINNYKPIFFNQKFKPYSDHQVVTKEYEAHLKNCQILSKNYYLEAVAKNFHADAKSFQIDPKDFHINPNNFRSEATNFPNGENNFQIGANNFQNGLTQCQNDAANLQNEASNFKNGSNNFPNGAKIFSNSPNNFLNGTSNFPNGVINFSDDPNNFQTEASNFSNGANNFPNSVNNFPNAPNNFANGANNLTNGANNFQKGQINFQHDANNNQFDVQSSNIVDHNMNTLPYNPKLHLNPTLLNYNQVPQNHQIFVRNSQIYNQITYDSGIEAYPEVMTDHGDPCFEWTENFKDQVLDDIDGIWSEGREALSSATEWLNLVDGENLDPNVKEICADLGNLNINTDDLNLNTTSSTDSATFMQGAALAPHSSEISLSTATDTCQRNELTSLVQRHATALKSLLSRANSDYSLCLPLPSSLTQQKRHSATNTTPDQSCDYYPTRDVGSNTPLTDPTNPTFSGDFDTKLDQLRERLAHDQIRFENSTIDPKLYTVFTKFQQSKPISTENFQVIEHNQLDQLLMQRNFECDDHKIEATERKFQFNAQKCETFQQENQLNEQNCELIDRKHGSQYKLQSNGHNLQSTNRKIQQVEYKVQSTDQKIQQVEYKVQSTDRKIQQVGYNVQSTDRKIQQVEYNVQSNEHNQHIEHKSGHYNMKTVNKLEMGSYKQTNNVGPYGRKKRSRNKNSFNYLGSKKSNQLNVCAID